MRRSDTRPSPDLSESPRAAFGTTTRENGYYVDASGRFASASDRPDGLSQAIMNAVQASVFVVSRDYKLVQFNEAFAREMELALDLKVTPGYDFLSLTTIGNPDRWKDLFSRVFSGIQVLERWEAVVPGHSTILEISAQPVIEQGQVSQAVFCIKNLTDDIRLAADYQHSMERAKLALESTDSLAFDWDLVTQKIQITNLEGITGYAATEETLSVAWWFERVIEEDQSKLNLAIADIFLEGDTLSVDYRITDISGRIKDVHTKAAVFRDADARPIRLVGVTQDITPRKMLERELIEARVTAEHMNRLKSSFLANMSHEIRTPLTAVIGYADVLSEELAGSELGEYSSVISRSGKRLLLTINSLLDLAKIEADMLELRPETVCINTLAACIAEELRPIAQQSALSLKLEWSEEQFVCLVDRNCVARILYNLVGNALKFTTHGGVTLRLGEAQLNAIPVVRIDVIDTGVGIADTSRIFEPFVQESDGVARKFEGTGLGLSITRKLVQLLGGAISVQSESGTGSTFTVLLPLKQPD